MSDPELRRETNDLWFGAESGSEESASSPDEAECLCGHPAWMHTTDDVGDCLHRSDGRYDCPCERFARKDTDDA